MNEKYSQNKVWVGASLAVLATIIWSGNFIIARSAKDNIPPITLAFYRWLSATLILLPFTWKLFVKEFGILKKRLSLFPFGCCYWRLYVQYIRLYSRSYYRSYQYGIIGYYDLPDYVSYTGKDIS